MSNFEKAFTIVKTLALVTIVGACLWQGSLLVNRVMSHFDTKDELFREQMVKLSENIVSQRVEISEKLLKERIKELDDSIKDMAKKRDQEITQVGNMIAGLRSDLREQVGNTYIDEEDSMKDYYETVVYQKDVKGQDVPWGWAMFSPNVPDEDKWTSGSYPLDVNMRVALGENEDRSDAYVEAWLTSDIFKRDKGKKFPIEVKHVDWVKAPPKEKSWMWNPRLSLGMAGTTDDFFPELSLSFFSYGRSKGDMDWRFLSTGIGQSSDYTHVFFAPVEYNIGKPIPILENLFISPFIGLNDDSETTYGIKLDLPL